jgi:hypothetical protein
VRLFLVFIQFLTIYFSANAAGIDDVVYRRCATQLKGDLEIGKKITLKKIGCGESVKEFTFSNDKNYCRYQGKIQNPDGFSCQIWGNRKFSMNAPKTIEVAEKTSFGFKSEKGALGFVLFNRQKTGDSLELVCIKKGNLKAGLSMCEAMGDFKIGDLKSSLKSLDIDIKSIREETESDNRKASKATK